MYEWDNAKAQANIEKHGVGFETARDFDWSGDVTFEDTREAYGERRFISFGTIGDRVYQLVWTPRSGKTRLISLRKANRREVRKWQELK